MDEVDFIARAKAYTSAFNAHFEAQAQAFALIAIAEELRRFNDGRTCD